MIDCWFVRKTNFTRDCNFKIVWYNVSANVTGGISLNSDTQGEAKAKSFV